MKAFALGLTFAVFAACAPAGAHQYRAGDIAISHPWSRPAAAGMNGVGYLTLTNSGGVPDTLVAVETAVAGKAEIHESSVTGGVMRMRELPAGLSIAPGAKVSLQPGGAHLMMLKLKQPLKVGDKVPVTLVFERAGRIGVSLPVQAAPPAAPEHHHH